MLILNNGQLKQFYQKCQKDKIIAIDTEFHRVHTYYPKLCLLQLANTSQSIILDPLNEPLNLNFLNEILFDSNIKKIFHAASQDIEILFNIFDKVPKNIIDTQIYLMPLGYSNSTSYFNACLDFLKIKLSKDNQFIDWRIRPLSQEKIKYALNDVKYLIPLYEKIIKKLKKLNRVLWAKEMHEKIFNKENYSSKASRAWEKIKFNPKNQYELGLLKEISCLREQVAMKKNIPAKKVLDNKHLIKICKTEHNINQKTRILDKIVEKKFRVKIIKIIQSYDKKKQNRLIDGTLNNKQKKNLKIAKELLDKKCKLLNIHPSLIANKIELKKIILGDKNIIKDWKFEIFSKEYIQIQKLI
mgnify:CR=1 FL=1